MTTEPLPNALTMSDADYARERRKPDPANYHPDPTPPEPMADDAPLANALTMSDDEYRRVRYGIVPAERDPRLGGMDHPFAHLTGTAIPQGQKR